MSICGFQVKFSRHDTECNANAKAETMSGMCVCSAHNSLRVFERLGQFVDWFVCSWTDENDDSISATYYTDMRWLDDWCRSIITPFICIWMIIASHLTTNIYRCNGPAIRCLHEMESIAGPFLLKRDLYNSDRFPGTTTKSTKRAIGSTWFDWVTLSFDWITHKFNSPCETIEPYYIENWNSNFCTWKQKYQLFVYCCVLCIFSEKLILNYRIPRKWRMLILTVSEWN